MLLREYKPDDCSALAKLFYDTVHCINCKDYTEEQINAWATGTIDLAQWNASFLEHHTIVAELDGEIAGFGDITADGYLDRLYVHKDYQRRGVAKAICDVLERSVKADKITTHASITAKGFFEKRGYRVIKEQKVERQKVVLVNYVMERCLGDRFL